MKQIDLSSMTKAELEKYALDTSRKLDEVQQSLNITERCFALVRLRGSEEKAKSL